MIDKKTFVSWSNYLRETIDSLKTEGYVFNLIGEMDITTLAHKRDLTYYYCFKHNRPAGDIVLIQNLTVIRVIFFKWNS